MSDNINYKDAARNESSGFTIVELLIAISTGSVVALAVLSVSLFFVADILRSSASTSMAIDSQNILRLTVEDMRTGVRVLETNTITDTNAPVGGWNTGNADVVLIVSVPATNSSHEFIFDLASGEPYQNEVIYYALGTQLLKRVLANSAATGNTSLTTCPEASSSSSCPADRELSRDFESMIFTFYDTNDQVTAVAQDARSVNININLLKDVYGNEVRFDNDIRVTLRNPT